MRKHQALLIALALFLCSAVAAQAQNFAEVKLFTTPADYAREGGKNEAAGTILLNTSSQAAIEADRCNDHAEFLRSPCGRYSHSQGLSYRWSDANRGLGHIGRDGGER